MNVIVIKKPEPHCPIPYGHPLFAGFVPAEQTDVRRTWARSVAAYGDDYDTVSRQDWLNVGGFR